LWRSLRPFARKRRYSGPSPLCGPDTGSSTGSKSGCVGDVGLGIAGF
jgi:hypothetical protein